MNEHIDLTVKRNNNNNSSSNNNSNSSNENEIKNNSSDSDGDDGDDDGAGGNSSNSNRNIGYSLKHGQERCIIVNVDACKTLLKIHVQFGASVSKASGSGTNFPTVSPTYYPTYYPTIPTTIPTMSNDVTNNYIANYHESPPDLCNRIRDCDKLSMYLPYDNDAVWIKLFDESIARNRWLIGYETQFSFDDEYDVEWFNVRMNCSFKDDSEWDIEDTNPVFVIASGDQFLTINILDNGTILATGTYNFGIAIL